MNKFKRFVPLTKIDEEQRMVFGFASTPDLDSDGEIVELEALKNALPDYMAFPTVREMHQPKAAGTTKSAEIVNDEERGKGLWIGAKIVADDAWELVKEGVYRGFSIGGHVVAKVENKIKAIDLVEISLVDVPANKAATIELWKRGQSPKDKKVMEIANVLAKVHKQLKKDATTTVIVSDLIRHLKDIKFVFEIEGRSTSKIDGMIEQAKKIIVIEASEKEKRKGVNIAMSKKSVNKAEEVDGKDQTKADEAKSDKVENEADATDSKEDSQAEDQGKVEADEQEGSEEKESDSDEKQSAAEVTLAKTEKMLDKIGGKEAEKLSLNKTVNAMASTVNKIAGVMAKMETRIARLEDTPAATKSEASFVHKDGEKEEVKADSKKNEERASEISKRLKELGSLKEKLGPNQFAKQGFSLEAGRLQTELEKLG